MKLILTFKFLTVICAEVIYYLAEILTEDQTGPGGTVVYQFKSQGLTG